MMSLVKAELLQEVSKRLGDIGPELLTGKNKSNDPDGYYVGQFSAEKLKFFAEFASHLEVTGEKLLDAGGGVGSLSFFIAALHPDVEVFCVDVSDKAVKVGRSIAEKLGLDNIRFARCNLESLPYDPLYFDFVVCRGVIHLVDLTRTLSEFHRVLSGEGQLVITVNGDGFYVDRIENHNKMVYAIVLLNALYRRLAYGSSIDQWHKWLRQVWNSAGEVSADAVFAYFESCLDSCEREILNNYPSQIKAWLFKQLDRFVQLDLKADTDSERVEQLRQSGVTIPFPLPGFRSRLSCYYPHEFSKELSRTGFRECRWQRKSQVLSSYWWDTRTDDEFQRLLTSFYSYGRK